MLSGHSMFPSVLTFVVNFTNLSTNSTPDDRLQLPGILEKCILLRITHDVSLGKGGRRDQGESVTTFCHSV